MKFIDPHIHMISRTTYDYIAMKTGRNCSSDRAGILAGAAPNERRQYARLFQYDLSDGSGFSASQFGIKHYCTIGLNSKEANNEKLADEVMELIPRYAAKEGVVAIGEIGYDDMTKTEEKYFSKQVEFAKENDMLVMVHTPHRNKKEGAIRSMDLCEDHGMDPSKVIIDHNNEETVKVVHKRGFWTAFTIYPETKLGNKRMVEIVKEYGSERIIIDSSADWGHSDPLSVPKTAKLMLERGISREDVHKVSYQNALVCYGQSGEFNEEDWQDLPSVDFSETFSGNSIRRDGNIPVVEGPRGVEEDIIIE
jgi:uncharacterized protein